MNIKFGDIWAKQKSRQCAKMNKNKWQSCPLAPSSLGLTPDPRKSSLKIFSIALFGTGMGLIGDKRCFMRKRQVVKNQSSQKTSINSIRLIYRKNVSIRLCKLSQFVSSTRSSTNLSESAVNLLSDIHWSVSRLLTPALWPIVTLDKKSSHHQCRLLNYISVSSEVDRRQKARLLYIRNNSFNYKMTF